MQIIDVIIPFNLNQTFSYLSEKILSKGNLVKINFNRKKTIGLVINNSRNFIQENNQIKLKTIIEIHYFSLKESIVDFIMWFSKYNFISIGLTFKLFISENFMKNSTNKIIYYQYLGLNIKKTTKLQENIVNFFIDNKNQKFSFNELKNLCSLNMLQTLIKNNFIKETFDIVDKFNYTIDLKKIKLNNLTKEQNIIFEKICNQNDNKPILLEGVTGSGKTEIYFHLYKQILSNDKQEQILFLLPEIGLTTQLIERFKQQFNCEKVAVWHSNISEIEKNTIWQQVLANKIKIVIGTRSSLFLPFENLKLIVIDEEHDNSYKQAENGCYNCRDMAIVRAKLENFKIVLGSATPSIESLINVENNKYNYHFLDSRFGKSTLPTISIIDLKKERLKINRYLSKSLIDKIGIELKNNNQILLYLNKRGYAPIALCKECGYKFLCKHCSCNLTVHKSKNKFICHQCGYTTPEQCNCLECGAKDSIIFFGPGIEKIEIELKENFPDVRILTITSDTTDNVKTISDAIKKIQNNEIDIILGTQMITKGYDFPNLTLVGVLDADANLFGANFRATEKTYQILTQVIGRAGRREKNSEAIIQTYTPENLIIQAIKNNDKNQIISFEKENRKIINLPPFGKLIMIIFYGKEEIKTYRKIKEFVNLFPIIKGLEILGPTPTNLFKLNNFFRFKVLFKMKNNVYLNDVILNTLKRINLENVKIKIDVNPYFIV